MRVFRNSLKWGVLPFLLLVLSGYCFAQPSNDQCFGAVTLSPSTTCNPITGTVANATQSLPGCTGTADDDVWYSFIATQSSLSVIVNGSASFNPVIQVFSGGCLSNSSIACVNNTGNGGTESANLNTLIVGITYWVRVYHFGASYPSTPNFTICVSAQLVMPNCNTSPPAGNTCGQSTFICDVNGYCGSTSSAYTADYWPELGSAFCGSIENNSFLSFVADASTVSLNVWVTSSAANNGIQIMVFSAANCSGPVTTYCCASPISPNTLSTSPSVVTATGLTPGNTYYLMIDGYAGDVCNYVIGVNSGVQVSGQIAATSANVCIGNSVVLTASGGNGVFSWIPDPTLSTTVGATANATPTTQGPHTYSMYTVSLNPLCPSDTTSIVINAFLPPTPNAGVDDTVCFGSQIHLAGTQTSPSNSIAWQTNSSGISPTPTVSFSPNFSSLAPTVTVNQPGLYKFILRETNSVCGMKRDTVKILVMKPTQVLSFVPPTCYGLANGEIHVDNQQANSYSFDNGFTWQPDSMKTGLAGGTYNVCSKNYLGCKVCSSITVVNPPPIGLSTSHDTTVCENGTAHFSAQGIGGASFSYHWSFTADTLANQQIYPIDDTLCTVQAENEFGCLSVVDTIQVTLFPPISGSITPLVAICPGYPAVFNAAATGGKGSPYTFLWSSGQLVYGAASSQSFSPPANTTYTVTVSDGCESTPVVLTTEVNVLPLPVLAISSLDNTICEPAQFSLTNETPPSMVDQVIWNISDGETYLNQQSITTNELPAGSYDVQLIVKAPNGCIDSTKWLAYLTAYKKPLAQFKYSPNPVKMFSTFVQFANSSLYASDYQWTFESGTPPYSQLETPSTTFPDGETGDYQVSLIATSEFGCSDTSAQKITVLPELIVYVPNTFTPNDDEHNQRWEFQIDGIDVSEFRLLLFNRWGELVWESYDPEMAWDGTYAGDLVEQGTYTWVLEAKDLITDGKYKQMGYVNVLR